MTKLDIMIMELEKKAHEPKVKMSLADRMRLSTPITKKISRDKTKEYFGSILIDESLINPGTCVVEIETGKERIRGNLALPVKACTPFERLRNIQVYMYMQGARIVDISERQLTCYR